LFFSVLLILLLNIEFKHLLFLEKFIIYIYLILQILTIISCFISWRPIIIIISHYILSISIIFIIFFSKNIYFLYYILLILILILILWFTKKNRCIFDNLSWDLKIGNKLKICYILIIYFILLLLITIAQFKKFNIFEKYSSIIILISQVITFYSCFVKWNPISIIINHYLLEIFILLFLLFSNNIYCLLYFLSVIILTIVLWYFKNDRCIFDRIVWQVNIQNKIYSLNSKNTKVTTYIGLFLYLLKIIYILYKYESK